MLQAVREAAASGENLVPVVMDAVDADATLGEVSNMLRYVWGTYDPPGGLD